MFLGQLVPYDAVNRNKVSIRQLPLFNFSFLLTTCFGPYGPFSGWDVQLDVSKDYSYYNGSVVRTQFDVCLYWYFGPWSPIHVIKLSIKVVKTLIFTVKLVSYIKYKNVKILKFKVSRRLYPLMMVWAVYWYFDHGSEYQYRHTSSCVSTTDPL
jgi:hypothetical protein